MAGTTLLAMGAWWLLLSFNGWTLIAHCSAGIKAKSAPHKRAFARHILLSTLG